MTTRALVCLALLATPAVAIAAPKPAPAPKVFISQAWIRQPPPGMDMVAGYATLVNKTKAPVVLTGVVSPLFKNAMMHESVRHGAEISMQMLDKVTIAPGKTYEFKPGGSHLMFMGPKHALKPGEQVPLVFQFKGFDAAATAVVKGP
ncbi:MAG TPA: copper chaperone PCu(A)C [Oscillatoriaceae cyanobacterium]